MQKIPCLFQRDFSDRNNPVLLATVTPGCEWVLAGEGFPTRKMDGTSCAIIQGLLYKRYDVKRGKKVPFGAIPCILEADPVTGHWPHWILVGQEADSKYHREAFETLSPKVEGTYELVGPKINGNTENLTEHRLIRHGSEIILLTPDLLCWEGLRSVLEKALYEGIVWHHPDGRMVKLRRDDYGFPWPLT